MGASVKISAGGAAMALLRWLLTIGSASTTGWFVNSAALPGPADALGRWRLGVDFGFPPIIPFHNSNSRNLQTCRI